MASMEFVHFITMGTWLGITDLHNGMIWSILSISSHGFALDFSKRPHTNRDSIPRL